MHANDVQIVRVYTKRDDPNIEISDQTFASNENIVVVVEAEAGGTLYGNGGPYYICITVRDLTDGSIILSPAGGNVNAMLEGNFTAAPWDDLALRYEFPPIAAQGAGKEHHVCDVIACLLAGVHNPNVSFAVSPKFVITPP